jgi:hypothetical protein
MTNTKLIQKILSIDESITNIIIKPKQLSILKKQMLGKLLNENEKRYLRGNLRKKLEFLGQFGGEINEQSEHQQFLNSIGLYYITGFEALKFTGFGWYYESKIIEIINTRIEGTIRLNSITLKFYRVRSITNSEFIIDDLTGLKYASNEQIIKDIKNTKNDYTEVVWKNMLNRYGKHFVKDPEKYSKYYFEKEMVDESMFGV